MCILHHQGRFLHNQRETHSHLSTRPPTPSSQTKKAGQTPQCAFLTTKDAIKHRRDAERDEGPKGIQKALFPQTKASPLLFFSSGIRQKSAPSRTSSSRSSSNSTITTTAPPPPASPLAARVALPPTTTTSTTSPAAPPPPAPQWSAPCGLSPRPSGCHDVCISMP